MALRSMLAVVIFFGVFFQCAKEKAPSGAMSVFVSILPQKYIVKKLCGPLADVSVMVQPGSSPHTYEPKPFQMAGLSKARAYFSIGVEFEKIWLSRFINLNSALCIVPMDSGIPKRPMDLSGEHGETRENPAPDASDHHRHAGFDPHIWLSPELDKKQAKTVCEALCRIDPTHASVYVANMASFVAQLSSLQDSIHRVLTIKDTTSRPTFMVFHPSWAYFADEFHLQQVAIEIEGKEPSAQQLQMIIETARKSGTRTIFVQPQFSRQSAEIIARQIHGRVEIADDLAYDICGNLLSFAKTLAAP